MTEVRRALFLSGSLGKGHDVVADVCGAALEGFGIEWRTMDSMAMLGRGFSAIGEAVFRRLLSVNAVFDAFHLSQMRDAGRLGRLAERAGVDKMYRVLVDEVDRFDPQLLVPVFPTGAGAAAKLKRQRPELTSVVVMTDSVAHSMWVHEETDLFLVTSKLAAESVLRYRPEARVEVVTAPVRAEFAAAPDRDEARRHLGVAVDQRCVLIMSGAWGIGPLDEAAEALAAEGHTVLAVAGTNAELERRLRAVAARRTNVVAFGFTEQIAELMAAADLVVTSSGDTCREARALARPLLLLDVVPGHGRENLLHELEVGGAAACSLTAESIVRSVRAFLADEVRSSPLPPPPPAQAERQFVTALRRLGLDLGPSGRERGGGVGVSRTPDAGASA